MTPPPPQAPPDCRSPEEAGFSLVELLVGALVFLISASFLFSLAAEFQAAASSQGEMITVMENTRVAADTVQRLLRRAGNDPLRSGTSGLTVAGPSNVRIRADVTGSAGPSNPDKGDPDGDVADSWEDIVIRFNAAADTIDLTAPGGSAQAIAECISGFVMEFFDDAGIATTSGAAIRKARFRVTGSGLRAYPRSPRPFGITLAGEVHLPGMARPE